MCIHMPAPLLFENTLYLSPNIQHNSISTRGAYANLQNHFIKNKKPCEFNFHLLKKEYINKIEQYSMLVLNNV